MELEEDESGDIPSEEERRRKKKKKKKRNEENIYMREEKQGDMTMEREKEEEEIKVTIETLSEHPDKISPLIGYFPSGFDPLRNQNNEQEPPPQPEVRVFRNQKRTQRLQLVVSPSGSQVHFVGSSHPGEATAGSQCTYALGVLDKETKTLKIVPIASNKIFRLEPKVVGHDASDKEPAKEELTADKKAEKRRERLLMYETKKAISQAKKVESLHQKEDPNTPENLEVKLNKIKINKEALETAGSHSARNIPFHDANATTPDMAYPLDKIISKSDWDFLLDVLENVQSGEEMKPPDVYPSFVCNRIHRLETMKDDWEKRRLAGVFSYINHLLKFKDKHSMEGSSSAKNHRIPSKILQRFATLFAESDTRRLPDEKRNLLISYVLVLTLVADDFRTDPTDIAKDLRMTAVELRRHYENLGCKLGREGTLLWATLPVPLKFPEIRGKRRKR